MQPFVLKMNISDYKYYDFMANHPELRLAPKDKVVSIMLEKGCINKSQADYLLGIPSVPDAKKYINPQPIDISEIFDANFSKTSSKQASYVLRIPQYHKTFKDLEINNNGLIDMNQFDINYIKNKYMSDRYVVNIKTEKALSVWVSDRNTKMPVFSLQYFDNKANMFTCNYYSDKKNRRYTFDNGKITKTTVVTQNGTKIKTFDAQGQVILETIKNSKGNYVKKTFYNNGYPFIDGVRNINILAEDLHNDIVAKTKEGIPTTRKSINTNILKRITKENVFTVLVAYNEQYGTNLLDDINNEISLKNKLKEKYINHIKNAMEESPDISDDAGKYIADILAKDIYGVGSGNLEHDIYLVNKNNISAVLRNYYELTEKESQDRKYSNTIAGILLPSALSAPIEGLIEAIDMEFNLGTDVKERIFKHLLDCAKNSGFTDIEEMATIYTEDVKKDIELNKNDIEKLNIDFLRLGNRKIVQSNPYHLKPNGKIDSSFRQGQIGDCWLIASIISIIETPNGKKELEKLLDYDKNTGDVTVTLKGVDKKYKITAEEIEKYSQLSRGDGDIRAIEIAVDRYIKESAYQNLTKDFDIQSNSCSLAYKLLLGNSKSTKYNALTNTDFNDNNYAYSLGTKNDSDEVQAEIEGETDTKIKLFSKHAYAIIKSDEEYIYLKDPNFYTNISEQETNEELSDNKYQKKNKQPIIMKIKKSELEIINPNIHISKID